MVEIEPGTLVQPAFGGASSRHQRCPVKLVGVRREAALFLLGPVGAGQDERYELHELLSALARMAKDGDLAVLAMTIVPTQDGNDGTVGISFDFEPTAELLAAVEAAKGVA